MPPCTVPQSAVVHTAFMFYVIILLLIFLMEYTAKLSLSLPFAKGAIETFCAFFSFSFLFLRSWQKSFVMRIVFFQNDVVIVVTVVVVDVDVQKLISEKKF